MGAEVFVAVLVSLLIVSGVVSLWTGITRRRAAARLKAEGVVAPAEIVDLRVVSTLTEPSSISYSYAITYTFTIDTAGRSAVRYMGQCQLDLPYTVIELLSSGTVLGIRYLPTDPGVSKVEYISVSGALADPG